MQHEVLLILANEFPIAAGKPEHKLCSRAQSEHIEGVHKLCKVQAQRFPGPWAVVMGEELQETCLNKAPSQAQLRTSKDFSFGRMRSCTRTCGRLASEDSHTKDCRLFEASSHRTATPSLFIDIVQSCTRHSALLTSMQEGAKRTPLEYKNAHATLNDRN